MEDRGHESAPYREFMENAAARRELWVVALGLFFEGVRRGRLIFPAERMGRYGVIQ